jgi:hypothetical protein
MATQSSIAQRSPSLEGAVAKLERAAVHIADLEAAVKQKPPEVQLRKRCQLDKTGKRLTVSAQIVSVPTFPDAWSTIIGDAIQDIRAALEYLVYELICLETGCYWEGSQFPIATDPTKHGTNGRQTIQKLGRHWKVIETYQPYDTGPATSLQTMAFKYLQTFSNQDKHRLLVPVSSTAELLPSIDIIQPVQDCKRPRRTGVSVNAGLLESGAELIGETFLVTGPDPQVRVAEKHVPIVSFADPDLAGMSAAEIIHMIQRKANMLLCRFTPLF